jgi:hypothetical protein
LDLVYLTGENAKWKHSSRDEDWRNWGTCESVGFFEFESFLSSSERTR